MRLSGAWSSAALAVACGAIGGACSTNDADLRSDWEREHAGQLARAQATTQAVTLPPAPREADLLGFDAGPARDFAFFVDRSSISVPQDGIVRYSLVALSPAGARNVTYESMSCSAGEVLVHATGRNDGGWTSVDPRWRPATRPWHRALRREYFCPKGIAIVSAVEGAKALEQGAHPLARPPNPLSGR